MGFIGKLRRRILRKRLPQVLKNFNAVEDDGVWHLKQAFHYSDSKKAKNVLLQHILEERHHADVLKRLYDLESRQRFTPAHFNRARLYSDFSDWKTMAYIHQGEIDAVKKFSKIVQASDHAQLKSELGKIIEDEEGHCHSTDGLIADFGVGKRDLEKELSRIRRIRFKQNWLTMGNKIGLFVFDLFATLLYFLLGSLFFGYAKRRMAQPKPANDQMQSLEGPV